MPKDISDILDQIIKNSHGCDPDNGEPLFYKKIQILIKDDCQSGYIYFMNSKNLGFEDAPA